MPIHIDCPVCAQRLRVPNFAAGRITKCTSCGNAVRVPQPKVMLEDEPDHSAKKGGTTNAAKQRDDRPEGPLTPSEIWYRSIERLSGSLDWLAERPIRILPVVLVLVGSYFGVAAAKWALSKPAETPIPSVEAEDPEPWEGVGTSDANDRVRVTAQSVTTEPIDVIPPNMRAVRKTPQAYLKIVLKIENLTPSPLKYSGWSEGPGVDRHPAKLHDDTGVMHKQVTWQARIAGQTPSAEIESSTPITDVLVFEPPGTYAKYLKLSLSAESCGGAGNLRIKIPRTRVMD